MFMEISTFDFITKTSNVELVDKKSYAVWIGTALMDVISTCTGGSLARQEYFYMTYGPTMIPRVAELFTWFKENDVDLAVSRSCTIFLYKVSARVKTSAKIVFDNKCIDSFLHFAQKIMSLFFHSNWFELSKPCHNLKLDDTFTVSSMALSAIINAIHSDPNNQITETQDEIMFELFGYCTQFLYSYYTKDLSWGQVVNLFNFINGSININESNREKAFKRFIRYTRVQVRRDKEEIEMGLYTLPYLTIFSDIVSRNDLIELSFSESDDMMNNLDTYIQMHHTNLAQFLEKHKDLVSGLPEDDKEFIFWVQTKVTVGSNFSQLIASLMGKNTQNTGKQDIKKAVKNDKVVCHAAGCCNNERLLSCSLCRSAWYCGKSCQKIDWPRHKQQCKTIRAANDLRKSA